MVWAIDDTVRSNKIDQLTAAIDADAAAGEIRLYDGAQPAKGGPPTTLLATVTFQNTSFPAAVAGVITAALPAVDETNAAAGTATWARVVDGAGVFVMDGTVTLLAGGGDVEMNTTTIGAGATVTLVQMVLTEGNA